MRVWWNTTLGETYEDDGEHPDEGSLQARRERWEGTPEAVLFKTAGVDVQSNRLVAELVGWGDREESWSLEYATFWGDPGAQAVWEELDAWLQDRAPLAACIDSGGHHTQEVYSFCADRYKRRVYAIKGMAGPGRTIWPASVSKPKPGVRLFVIGVDAAKDALFSQLKIGRPGPGYCHFPRDRDDEWFLGLTSETLVIKYSKGFPKREYVKRQGIPNEPLDCRVYAKAALASFKRVNWKQLALDAAKARETAETKQESAAIEQPRVPQSRASAQDWRNWAPKSRGNWMNRYR
jgi:phage terminase large subunit GpA-like protein